MRQIWREEVISGIEEDRRRKLLRTVWVKVEGWREKSTFFRDYDQRSEKGKKIRNRN